jgi:hypothetical protein
MTEKNPHSIESLLERDAGLRRDAAPRGLEARLFVATQANVNQEISATGGLMRVLRIGAPLAAAAVVVFAIWMQTGAPEISDEGSLALNEQDLELVLASDEWTSDLDDIDAFLDELNQLESALALDWSDDLELYADYDYEESMQ